jgi:4-hydroxybenzoate polyprenyltransferase
MEKTIRVSTWLCIAFVLVTAAFAVAYRVIGVEVDEQGYLREAFFLIPLAWLSMFSAVISAVVNLIARLIRAKKNSALKAS